jgi:replication factor A1
MNFTKTQSKTQKKMSIVSKKVKDLEPQTRGHNLVLGVVNCKVVVEKTRTDASKVKIAECLVGDETACIVLTARNGINEINFIFI